MASYRCYAGSESVDDVDDPSHVDWKYQGDMEYGEQAQSIKNRYLEDMQSTPYNAEVSYSNPGNF